ncbi:DUF7019 family protein [Mesorhizobium carmichaelinearum]|uniref:DUF7019 family protein n=1 Tax=Mesorhizobium carmichaelinearum TaxID=1208188 RepID=UPI000BA3600B|nr:SAVMC3_10250 family protein [Mesorhizobium carmichaelinearum]
MKYYLYISDSKVDMLLPQIPLGFKQKASAEFGFDIKVFSAKVSTEVNTLEDRVRRLNAVTDYIVQTQDMGTIDEPASWIADTKTVKYGLIGDGTKVTGYIGKSAETRFLLAGSSAHLVGSPRDGETIGHGFSYVPRLMTYLKSAIEYSENDELDEGRLENYLGKDAGDTKQSNWQQLITDGDYRMTEVTEIEFLAKRLMYLDGKKKVLLATPLYVAMVN